MKSFVTWWLFFLRYCGFVCNKFMIYRGGSRNFEQGRELRRWRRQGGVGVKTFGAFWALSFTLWMHVLHIKSSALDLKSAAKFTNWGVWAPVVLKRQTIRETLWWKTCFVSSLPSDVMRFAYIVSQVDLQVEHIKPLNWLKAGVAYHRYWAPK